MKALNLCLILLSLVSYATAQQEHSKSERSLADGIQSGLQMAGKMFGINTAADVADLVASTFSKRMFNPPKGAGYVGNSVGELFANAGNTHRDEMEGYESQTASYNPQEEYDYDDNRKPAVVNSLLQQELFNKRPESGSAPLQGQASTNPNVGPEVPTGMISNMLRIFGFDSGKLGAMAINGLIFIAQMIAQAFTKRNLNFNMHQSSKRSVNNALSVDWILNNPSDSLVELLEQVRDKNLPQKLVQLVSQFERNDGDADCIKLMLCKSSPFIWKMQKTIFKQVEDNATKAKGSRTEALFQNMPDVEEFEEHGEGCEDRYKGCRTNN